MHYILIGILLGMGAAIPIGPVNMEMIRRNLRYGTSYGIMLGLGACSADITYLALLCTGALVLLQYPDVLHVIGFCGSLVLAWFGINIFRSPATQSTELMTMPSLLRYGIEGYLITMINPYTILFWASISSQISLVSLTNSTSVLFTGVGVVTGTVGWVIVLNGFLHLTRHKLTERAIRWLNYTGGFILLGFSAAGIIRSFFGVS